MSNIREFEMKRTVLFFLPLFFAVILQLTYVTWKNVAIADSRGSNYIEQKMTETDFKDPNFTSVDELKAFLDEKKSSIEGRERSLGEKEVQLKELKNSIDLKLQELQFAQERLESLIASVSSAAEKDLKTLVEIYSGMKSKEAAKIINEMEEKFAAGLMSEFDPEVSSAIMQKLDPEKAYAISSIIAARNLILDVNQ